jgi:23S rRNA (adenine2503-C2)-methyltransferase
MPPTSSIHESVHNFDAADRWLRSKRMDRQPLRRLRTAFYKKARGDAAALQELPDEVRSDFAAHFEFHPLALASRHDSALDGASKLIFRTSQDLLLESVILRMTS